MGHQFGQGLAARQFGFGDAQITRQERHQQLVQLDRRQVANIDAVEPFQLLIRQGRRLGVDRRNIAKTVDHLGAGKDLPFRVKVPADVGQEIEHGIGQIPRFDKFVDQRQILFTVDNLFALAHLALATGIENHGQVGEHGHLPAKGIIELFMQ